MRISARVRGVRRSRRRRPGLPLRSDLADLALGVHLRPGLPGHLRRPPRRRLLHAGRALRRHGDEKRVGEAVAPAHGGAVAVQAEAQGRGWVELEDPEQVAEGEEPGRKTRVVDGACIFLNRPGFAGRRGLRAAPAGPGPGPRVVETKPDVCWQLPLRRQFRTVTRTDETTYTEVSIGEYGRDGWGPGGHDLDWYCTSNTEAHHGRRAGLPANRAELVALMGARGYELLVGSVREFEQPSRTADAPSRGPGTPRRSTDPATTAPAPGGRARPGHNEGMHLDHLSYAAGPEGLEATAERLGTAARRGLSRRRLSPAVRHPEPDPAAGRRPATSRWSQFSIIRRPTRLPFGQAVRARSAARRRLAGLGGRRGRSRPDRDGGSAAPPSAATGTGPTGRCWNGSSSACKDLQNDPQLPFFVEVAQRPGAASVARWDGVELLKLEIAGDHDRVDDWLGGMTARCSTTWTSTGLSPDGSPGLIGRDLQHPARAGPHLSMTSCSAGRVAMPVRSARRWPVCLRTGPESRRRPGRRGDVQAVQQREPLSRRCPGCWRRAEAAVRGR